MFLKLQKPAEQREAKGLLFNAYPKGRRSRIISFNPSEAKTTTFSDPQGDIFNQHK